MATTHAPQDLTGKLAVVTGASSGLGAEFAKILAGRGCSLLLTARTKSRLEEMQRQLSSPAVVVHVLPLDLGQSGAPLKLIEMVRRERLAVDFLINNAGFGSVGSFQSSHWETDEGMIDLNIRALTHLTRLFVSEMLQRGEGRILNVASAAAFQPMPYFAVYAATKSYVLHLTEALNFELAKTSVRISALCPGPVKTAFWETAGGGKNSLKNLALLESDVVARYGVELMLRGDSVGIPDWLNRLRVFCTRLVPRSLVTRVSGSFMKPR